MLTIHQGSWNLHEVLPRDLDFFVFLSSLAGVIGSISQANYAAGNTYQDALAHYRQSQGLAARSIDLGLMKGIGYVEEHEDVAAHKSSLNLVRCLPCPHYSPFRCVKPR